MLSHEQNSLLNLQRNNKKKKKEFSTSCSCNSSCDAVLFYESKLKKLKHNNISLAVTLADQRHVSQTWYNEVIALKGKLLETQSILLKSHGNMKVNSNLEIQKAAEIIKKIVTPFEAAAQDCINHSHGLAEGMKTISHLASTLLNFTDEKMLNLSTHSNHSSGGRTSLISTHKISGKNSIHSMDERYILNSPAICSPKIMHDKKEIYNFPYCTNSQESNQMNVIPEYTNICKEKDKDPHSLEAKAHLAAQFLKDTSKQMSLSFMSESPCLELADKNIPVIKELDASPIKLKERDQINASFDSEYFLKKTTGIPPKRRSSKMNRSSVTNQILGGSFHLFQKFSNDSDGTIDTNQAKELSNEEMIQGKELNSSSDDNSSPTLSPLCNLSDATKVYRRSLNRMTSFQTRNESDREILRLPSSCSLFDEEMQRENCDESLLQVSTGDLSSASRPLSPLFETPAGELTSLNLSPSLSLTSCDSLSFTEVTTEVKSSISTDLAPPLSHRNKIDQRNRDNEYEDTCFLDSSMEITKCLSKEMLMEIVPADITLQPLSLVPEKDHLINSENKAKPKRFFKGLDLNERTVLKPKEKTPYDLSMIEKSFIDDNSLNKGKENLPSHMKNSDALEELTSGMNDASINNEDVSSMTKAVFLSPENLKRSKAAESSCHPTGTSPLNVDKLKPRRKDRNIAIKGFTKEGEISISPPQHSFLDCTFSLKCDTRWTSPTRRKKKGKSHSNSKSKLHQSNRVISHEAGEISQTVDSNAEKALSCQAETLSDKGQIFKQKDYFRKGITITYNQSRFATATEIPSEIDETIENPFAADNSVAENNKKNGTKDKKGPDAIASLSVMEHENQVAFDGTRAEETTRTDGQPVFEARSTPIDSCSNSRPRRAATQTTSFKEVSLKKKLRQETTALGCGQKSKRSRSRLTH